MHTNAQNLTLQLDVSDYNGYNISCFGGHNLNLKSELIYPLFADQILSIESTEKVKQFVNLHSKGNFNREQFYYSRIGRDTYMEMRIIFNEDEVHVYKNEVLGNDTIQPSLYFPEEISWELIEGKVHLSYPNDTSDYWCIPFLGNARPIIISCIHCFCHHNGYCKVGWSMSGTLFCVGDPCNSCVMELNSPACDRVLYTGGGVILKARRVIEH
jgi:hypothetical protein